MSQFHFEDEQALQAQHISDDEVRRVVQLWNEQRAEREQQQTQPTVQAMAEGLGIPTDEAVRLLREVRGRDALVHVERAAAAQRRRVTIRSVAAAAAIVFVLVVMLLKLAANHSETMSATVEPPLAAGVAGSYVRGADGSVRYAGPEGTYEYRADGSLRVTSPEGTYERGADGSLRISGPSGSYTRGADGSEARQGTPPTIKPPTPPPGVTPPAVP